MDKKTLKKAIDLVIKSEGTLHSRLGQLSRDLINYIGEHGDIGLLNRLIAGLTKNNRDAFILFCKFHIPARWDAKNGTFGKKRGPEAIAICGRRSQEFLADGNNTFWTWAERNVETKNITRDFATTLANAVAKYINPKEAGTGANGVSNAISKAQVIRSVIEGGVTASDIVDVLENMTKQANTINKKLNANVD